MKRRAPNPARPGARPSSQGRPARGGSAGRPGRPGQSSGGGGVRAAVQAKRLQVSADDVAEGILWILILATPLLFSPGAKESFRLPKLMAAEWLGLASLVPLAWKMLRRDDNPGDPGDPEGADRVAGGLWHRLARWPALAAVLPLLLVATAGLATTLHPLHVRQALADLWIGAACLVGWSLGLPRQRLERLLGGLLIPGSILAVIGILQFHGLWHPLLFLGIRQGERLAVTSTAGNPGDLGAYLVLPCLAAQWLLARGGTFRAGAGGNGGGTFKARAGGNGINWAGLAVCLYALAVTQTLAALVAIVGGSIVFWLLLLPRRKALVAVAAGVALTALLVALTPPLRVRVTDKARQMAAGDWNSVLTGRLDGWRAAAWMLHQHPWAGVGHGAYRAEFANAKLALLDRGDRFFPGQLDVFFANAHNDVLEVGADGGVPGLLALGWGAGVLAAVLMRRRRRGEGVGSAFAWGGTAAVALLSLATFPFRVALVAFPVLLFLAWVLQEGALEGAEPFP